MSAVEPAPKNMLAGLYLQRNLLTKSIPEGIQSLQLLVKGDVYDNSLEGNLPEAIGSLQRLDTLVALKNAFAGALPHALFALTAITVWSFERNKLAGAIPSAVRECSSAVYIGMSKNSFAGAIPEAMGGLSHFGHLHAGLNKLQGDFRQSFPWRRGNMMREVFLNGNKLAGQLPDAIGHLQSVMAFDLGENKLVGSLPVYLGLMKRVQDLAAPTNALTGSIAPIGVRSLRRCALQANRFEGAIPDRVISTCKEATMILLFDNALAGAIPEAFRYMQRLQVLDLTNDKLQGSLPEALGYLQSSLADLRFMENHLAGSIPDAIGDIAHMSICRVTMNFLTGALPEAMFAIPMLEQLSVGENRFTGSLPEAIGQSQLLWAFTAEICRLSSSIPDAIGSLRHMSMLFIHNNSFSATLPEALWRASNLTRVQVQSNKLSGALPNDIKMASRLKDLVAGYVPFSGTLPDSVRHLTALQELHIYQTSITGAIPDAVQVLASLINLDVPSNFLQGHLPDGLAGLITCTALLTANNLLTGSLPHGLLRMAMLERLSVFDNTLRGSIPGAFCRLSFLADIQMSGNELQGTIPMLLGLLSLSKIHIRRNLLQGTVPAMLFKIRTLRGIAASRNLLVGTLPQRLSMPFASYIVICDNKLAGTLPDMLQGLRHMKFLSLHSNDIEGSIPAAVGAFRALTVMVLGHNRLEQSLPSSMGDLRHLVMLDIGAWHWQTERIQGTIPQGLARLLGLASVTLHSQSLQGITPAFESTLGLLAVQKNALEYMSPIRLVSNGDYRSTIFLFQNRLSCNVTHMRNGNGTERVKMSLAIAGNHFLLPDAEWVSGFGMERRYPGWIMPHERDELFYVDRWEMSWLVGRLLLCIFLVCICLASDVTMLELRSAVTRSFTSSVMFGMEVWSVEHLDSRAVLWSCLQLLSFLDGRYYTCPGTLVRLSSCLVFSNVGHCILGVSWLRLCIPVASGLLRVEQDSAGRRRRIWRSSLAMEASPSALNMMASPSAFSIGRIPSTASSVSPFKERPVSPMPMVTLPTRQVSRASVCSSASGTSNVSSTTPAAFSTATADWQTLWPRFRDCLAGAHANIRCWSLWMTALLISTIPLAMYLAAKLAPDFIEADRHVFFLLKCVASTYQAVLVNFLVPFLAYVITGSDISLVRQERLLTLGHFIVLLVVPCVVTVFLEADCLGHWLLWWSPCKEQPSPLDISLPILEQKESAPVLKRSELCSSGWSGRSSACARSIVKQLHYLVLSKVITAMLVMPLELVFKFHATSTRRISMQTLIYAEFAMVLCPSMPLLTPLIVASVLLQQLVTDILMHQKRLEIIPSPGPPVVTVCLTLMMSLLFHIALICGQT